MTTVWEKLSLPRVCGLLAERPTTLSAAMHSAGFSALALPFVYSPFAVTDVKQPIAEMRQKGYRGYSVTIPFKESVMPLLDSISTEASEIGAVNTVINDGKQLVGYNTDLFGIVEALKEAAFELANKRVIVLGAGGAARAAVLACKKLGAASVMISNRDERRAKGLADIFHLSTLPLKELEPALLSCDLLVNCTPLGSQPQDTLGSYPFALTALPKSCAVFDLVTRDTLLTTTASAVGADVITGPQMLLFQALQQFRLFTEVEPPKAVMEAALKQELAKI